MEKSKPEADGHEAQRVYQRIRLPWLEDLVAVAATTRYA